MSFSFDPSDLGSNARSLRDAREVSASSERVGRSCPRRSRMASPNVLLGEAYFSWRNS